MSVTIPNQSFQSKKAAKELGFLTEDQWFRKWQIPIVGEAGLPFRGELYFAESQTEEVFSKSRGQKEIGPLREGVQTVGQKKFRTVKFGVYRVSDFKPKPKVVRQLNPPRNVEICAAILKIHETVEKYDLASKRIAKSNPKRSRGFRSLARNLTELMELGIRRAVLLEEIVHLGKRGGVHRYLIEGHEIKARVVPPEWFERHHRGMVREPNSSYQFTCRLMDAIHTVEKYRDDPTLNW